MAKKYWTDKTKTYQVVAAPPEETSVLRSKTLLQVPVYRIASVTS